LYIKGVPGMWDQKIRYACKINICSLTQYGSCQGNNPSCPAPPPELPATGIAERKRFFAEGNFSFIFCPFAVYLLFKVIGG